MSQNLALLDPLAAQRLTSRNGQECHNAKCARLLALLPSGTSTAHKRPVPNSNGVIREQFADTDCQSQPAGHIARISLPRNTLPTAAHNHRSPMVVEVGDLHFGLQEERFCRKWARIEPAFPVGRPGNVYGSLWGHLFLTVLPGSNIPIVCR
jgi:hypothetical protein